MSLHVTDSPVGPKVFLNADSHLILDLFQLYGRVRFSKGGTLPIVFEARIKVLLVFLRNEGRISDPGRL